MRYLMVLLGLCGLPGPPAHALDCKSGGATQSEMDECANNRFKKSDAELNAKYKKIMDCLKPSKDSEKPLVEAERAWLRFRDAECKFQGSASAGGSVQPMIVASCLEAITKRRNKDLGAYLSCREGDMACPVPPDCGSHEQPASRK